MKMFELVLSTKERIAIDEADYYKLADNIGEKHFIKLKQAIVNPAYVVAILPKGQAEGKAVIEEGYVDEERGVFIPTKVAEGVPPLADEFATKTKALAASMTVPPR